MHLKSRLSSALIVEYMDQAIPYPIDYQRSLERTLRIRLDASRAGGRTWEVRKLEEGLARLRSAEYGICLGCGGVIPFLQMADDPARTTCLPCVEKHIRRL